MNKVALEVESPWQLWVDLIFCQSVTEGFKYTGGIHSPQRSLNSQHPPSLAMESVSSSISYRKLLTCGGK